MILTACFCNPFRIVILSYTSFSFPIPSQRENAIVALLEMPCRHERKFDNIVEGFSHILSFKLLTVHDLFLIFNTLFVSSKCCIVPITHDQYIAA